MSRIPKDTRNKWLREQIAALRGTRKLAVHRVLSRFLCAVRLALYLARSLIPCIPKKFFSFGIFGFCLLTCSEAISAYQVHNTLRGFGYRMGDLVEQQVTISADSDAEIEALVIESLPLPGSVKPWLDLRDSQFHRSARKLHLTLTWQLFATVEQVQVLRIPSQTIRVRGQAKPVLIPAAYVQVSPIFEKPIAMHSRYANIPAPAFDTWQASLLLASGLVLMIFSVLAWLWLWGRLPNWLLPSTRLGKIYAEIRVLSQGQVLSTAQLRALHTALNAMAQTSLTPTNLQPLFERAAYLQPMQAEISRFFQRSWQIFFADSQDGMTREQVLYWLKDAVIAEQLARPRDALLQQRITRTA